MNKHDRKLFIDGYARPCYDCKRRKKCSWDNGAEHCTEYGEWLKEVWCGFQKLRETAGYDFREEENYADDNGYYPDGEKQRHRKKTARRPITGEGSDAPGADPASEK